MLVGTDGAWHLADLILHYKLAQTHEARGLAGMVLGSWRGQVELRPCCVCLLSFKSNNIVAFLPYLI